MENTRKLKLRFLMLYFFSFILMLAVVIGLWKKTQLLKQPAAEGNQQIIVREPQPTINDAQAGQEIQNLKNQLAEKDQQLAVLQQTKGGPGGNAQLVKDLAEKNNLISSLQAQIKQKDALLQSSANTTGGQDGEWKQKYAVLKASYDKSVNSENALRSAYKTVADDNKRLLSQLQSIKKD